MTEGQSAPPSATEALAGIYSTAHGGRTDPPRVEFVGPAESLPTVFSVTTAAASSIGAATAAASRLWQVRHPGSDFPPVGVDHSHAAAAFRSERYLQIDGREAPGLWEPLSQYYRTADDTWFLLHANMPPHRAAALKVLGAAPTPDSVSARVATWHGSELEDALAEGGGCGAVLRTEAQWLQHPQGIAVGQLPVIEIDRIGDGPDSSLPHSGRPAGDVRVLDLTRVIAGPVATRTLASHGAEVLRIGAPYLWDSPTLVIDTGFGKRTTNLDLRTSDNLGVLRRLLLDADVLVQAYRPSSLKDRGLGPEEAAAVRPGLIYVSISAYGHRGPWSSRRGFDSLVQMASGIVAAGSAARGNERPLPLPAQALDHATGYLAAFGAMEALARRQAEGGSWLVRLSLAQTGAWLMRLGRRDTLDQRDPTHEDVRQFTDETQSPFGVLRHIRPAGRIVGLTPHWEAPPSPLGSHPATWAT